MSYLFLR